MEQKEILNEREIEIREITDKKVLEFMKLNPDKVELDSFRAKLEQAKLGMVFTRDREMMKRISQGQQIRVFNLISTDKAEMQRYIEVSMPEVIPKKQIK